MQNPGSEIVEFDGKQYESRSGPIKHGAWSLIHVVWHSDYIFGRKRIINMH